MLLKVGLVSSFMARCGIATYSNFLGEELKNLGVDVIVLSERKDVLPDGFDPNFKTSLKHIECWSRNEPFDELLKVVKKEKITLLHFENQFGLFPNTENLWNLYSSLKTMKIMNCKIVTTLHDVVNFDPNMVSYFQTIIDFSDKIIVHTNLCYQLMLTSWKCPKEKLVQIMHGTKLFEVPSKETSRKKLNLPLDSEIILSWGFIWESKGILETVEVFAEILKTHPKAIFIHAGGLHPVFKRNDYIRNILKKAMQLGVKPENFKITGFVEEKDIPIYFGASDLVVLNFLRGSASASGSSHIALSSHQPILKSDDPCLEDIIGFTFLRMDKTSLYRGILKLLEDKKLQEELVKDELRVAKETSWEETAKKHLVVYNEVS